ncbi:MAG: APC family permease, partial [Candidatus Thorarchaeota archaeon]
LITTASEEIKDPARTIPRAILLTLLIATAVYVVASFVIVGVVPYTGVQDNYTPVAFVYGNMLGPAAFYFGLAGMAASNFAALNATFLSTARVAFALGRDRFFPKMLESVHSRLKTPIPALILTFVAVAVFASTGRVELVASLAGLAYLIGQTIVNSSVIALREKGLTVPGTFKSRFYPLVPILGVSVCVLFILNVGMESLWMGLWLAALGLLIYIGYSRRRNKAHLASDADVLLTGTDSKE